MLTKKQKTIIMKILSIRKAGEYLRSDTDLTDLIRNDMNQQQLDSLLDDLHGKGYFADYKTFLNGGRGFKVCHQTECYKEIETKTIINYFTGNLLVPIIVGVLSSLIITIIIT